MKKISVVVLIIGFLGATEFIPREKIQEVAYKFLNPRFGKNLSLSQIITYYGWDENPNAYGLVFEETDGDYITIIMGARYTTSPIGEVYQGQPHCIRFLDRAKKRLEKAFAHISELDRYYYFGTGEEYAGFRIGGKKVLINVLNLQLRTEDELFRIKPEPVLERWTREKWNYYLNNEDFASRQSNYIDSVPFIDWVYGCSPTAASMMFWYWDHRNYGKLVDYFYTHWDTPENEWNDCANTNRELALAMNTDTLTGGTYISNIAPGMLTVANSYNGYSFSASTSPQGGYWNQWVFSYLKNEIDAQRPCHWNVIQYWYPPMNEYINHSVTGVGYEITSNDTFVIVHTTWDNGEPLWPLGTYYNGVWSYDYVVSLIPGGSNPNNVILDYPRGGDIYNLPVMFKNLKYAIRWHTTGSDISYLKLWWSKGTDGEGYDSLRWTLIANNVANTGKYIWTCPNLSCSLRVNIAAMNASNLRLAADGSFGRTRVTELTHSANLNLIGHYDTPGWANDLVIHGNYAYIADGAKGITVLDISDSTLPDFVNQVTIPGNLGTIGLGGQYLFVGDKEDTFRVLSISNPTNPVEVAKLALSDDVLGLFVEGNRVYVAARSQGLVIVDVQIPSNPVIIGTYNTSGFAYDVVVANNLAYVADATKGVRIIDVSNPVNPVETGYYDTNGITYGVALFGNYLYAADGTAGIKVFDASSPDTLILLGSCDTPGTASGIQYYNGYCFVADGTLGGMRVIDVRNPNAPSEAGYILSLSSAVSVLVNRSLVYLPDGSTGLLIIRQDIVGIEEGVKGGVSFGLKLFPKPGKIGNPVHLQLTVTQESDGRLELFDLAGRKVATVYQGNFKTGINEFHWIPTGLSSGIYFIRAKIDSKTAIDKILLLK
ncbi:MAG: T9SS type A sorting domain-containing protein [candidate division WOR-3 bacterium]